MVKTQDVEGTLKLVLVHIGSTMSGEFGIQINSPSGQWMAPNSHDALAFQNYVVSSDTKELFSLEPAFA